MPQSDAETVVCMQCEQTLGQDQDREITQKGILCRNCYDSLSAQVKNIIGRQDKDINYGLAFVGAALGGIVGAVVWWGFTILTKIEFGLVAVVIGFTVAKGIMLLTGGKRSQGLQIMAVLVSAVAYFYANYLVTRTFIINQYPEMQQRLGLLPDLALFIEISRLSLGMFTLIFLGIVVWQAWQLTAPTKLE